MQAKDAASLQNKWLLVNIQSTKEFSSHMVLFSWFSIFIYLDLFRYWRY